MERAARQTEGRVARWVGALCLVAASACHGEAAAPSPSGSGSNGSAAVSASVAAPAATPASPPRDLSHDPVFVRAAASHDTVDLVALGEHAGASALVAALADPAARPTALSAIPYARDLDLAFRPVVALARSIPSGDDAFELLDALSRGTEQPRRIDELLDPDGMHAAVADLLLLAKDGARAERERALAITLLGRLADRGFVARADIPAL